MHAGRNARFAACLAAVAVVTAVCFLVVHTNATTVALMMLLVVLGVATRWGLAEATFTSIIAVLAFNRYFLPPIFTFTIADPQNWVALFAFLVTAVTTSQLSARAQRRAREALLRKQESERLYTLSRALLTSEGNDVQFVLREASRIFGLDEIAFYDRARDEVYAIPPGSGPGRETLVKVAESEEPQLDGSMTVLPVRLGRTAIGSLAIRGADATQEVRDSIATLVAINHERLHALDRAAAAEASRKNEQLKSTLLDGLAHDLNTPLSAIKTSVTTLLTHQFRTEASRHELLAIIEEETDRLHRVISEALTLARVESEKVNLDRAPCEASDLIARAILGSRADPDRIRVHAPDSFLVNVDAELFPLALKQLIENAARYSPPEADIHIDARSDPPVASFSVRDHGKGIKSGERERIFERYHRGSAGRRTSEGTGMGLAIAKAIVESHGGKIWAENDPEGGARFTILMPQQ
ncbi:MAG TPA: ATP-binding protein [Acidobacteriaceae bacterium]|nr:ATP-binding protein [Acidobacteriaceae bacterium]